MKKKVKCDKMKKNKKRGIFLNRTRKGMLAALIGNIIFGLSFLFSSVAFSVTECLYAGTNTFPEADVPAMLAIRFLVAFLFMTAMLPFLKTKVHFKGKPIWKLVILGFFQPVIYFIGESFGIKMTDIIISAVVIATVPVVAQIFSALFLKEKPTLAQVLFCLLSIVGVCLITFFSGGGNKKTYIIGVFCLLIAVFSAVGFNVMGRSISKEFTPFERTYFMFMIGAVFFWIYAMIAAKGNALLILSPMKEPKFIIAILYLSGLSSVGAYLLINYANTYIPVTRTTAFANIIPVVSTIAGFIVNKKFDILIAACCVVIIIGVWGVQKFKKLAE